MGRFRILIEYDGTRYSGWQMQKGSKSVQGEILDACRELFGGQDIDIYGAGRTDSGVHATGQTAHLEADTDLEPLRIKYGINDRLPSDISIRDVVSVENRFHARHDAFARSYVYQISRRRTALAKKYVWWIKDNLDASMMNKCAERMTGLKDFRSFTDDRQEQGSTKVEIKHCRVTESGDMILIHVIGSHFLWKQVRRMTGILVEAGRGNISSQDVDSLFREKSDLPARYTAPPSGLFLERVYYANETIITDVKPLINL